MTGIASNPVIPPLYMRQRVARPRSEAKRSRIVETAMHHFAESGYHAARVGDIAAAYGVNHKKLAYLLSGIGAGYAGVAGTFIALIATLAPAEIWAYLGVVFAVVIIGRLGNPLGALLAGLLIGASESLAMAVLAPAWAPVVSFSVLIAILLWDPEWL